MKRFISLTALLLWVGIVMAATWTGSSNTNWNNASNWNPASIPTSTTDVTIPNVTNKPIISSASANCRVLTINAGSSLTINSSYNLNASSYAGIYGSLIMSSSGDLYVSGAFFWESGSTASITNSAAAIYASGNMQFAAGSNVQMTNGTIHFQGSTASTDLANYSANTQIYAMNISKSTGTSFSIRTGGQPFTINSHITNNEGNTFYNYYTGDITLKGSINDLNSNSAYGIKWDNGTLIMDGTSPSIGVRSTTCYLKNLTFSQTGTAQLTYPLTLKGKLRIESGVFYPQAHNITLAGDWENVVGPAAFTEGTTARVIFNGSGHQYCDYSETFNIVEVNKSGGALRVNSSSAVVTCTQYDWTAGAIDVISGTFTANDLAENGIFGSYFVNPGGVINLTNNDSWVDLNGSMTFTNGGTINVYGGLGTSDWSYGGNASLTMNGGGILDFKNVGINIYNSGTYTFSYNINDYAAEIRTVGNFTCNRSTFTPINGKVVMYGGTDATLTMNAGSLYSIIVNKASTREEEINPPTIGLRDKLTGEQGELTRANTVNLGSNVTAYGDLNIENGVCNLQSYQVNCFRARTFGTLRMNNASAKLMAENQIIWRETGIADITLGTLETTGTWYLWAGANVILPVAVITNLIGTSAHSIFNDSSITQFGTLNIGGTATTGGIYTMIGSYSTLVAGNLSVRAGNELDLGNRNLTVNGDLNLNGTLDIHATTATIHGKPYLHSGSNLSIDTGTFYCDENTVPRQVDAYGTVSIASGLFNSEHLSYYSRPGGITTMTATGAQLICTGINTGFGTFQPTAGTVRLTGGDAGTYLVVVSGGNWLPNLIIDSSTRDYILGANLIIKGNLTIMQRDFDVSTSNYSITISGDWNHQGGTFTPRSGRVIFNGSGFQYINYTETFNILEVNKSAAALRVNSSTAVVTCAQYDWTAGALDVVNGTFTASDLADNGLFGNYYCTYPGIMNLTNTDGYVDLAGNVNISGGTINVYGGTTDSYWPYGANASLTMHGGNLVFKNTGIRIVTPGSLTFTSSFTGGTVRTVGDLRCYNSSFNHGTGTFELIGTTDVNLDISAVSLYKLYMSKNPLGTRESGQEEQSLRFSDKEGNSREATRASTVTLWSNLSAYSVTFGDINNYGGVLWLNGHEIDTTEDFSVWNGKVRMDSVNDKIVAHGNFETGNFFISEITQGVIETYGDLFLGQGSTILIPATVSIYLRATGSAELNWYTANCQLGNLFLAGSGGATHYTLVSYFPTDQILNIAGNLSIAAGNTLTLAEDPNISIAVGGNLDLDGTLIINGMNMSMQGKPDFAATSTLTVTNGSFVYYDASVPRNTPLRGVLNVNSSRFEAVNNSLVVYSGSVNNVTGSSSQIVCYGINAIYAGTFQPSVGTVVLTSNPANALYHLEISNGNWLPNVILNTGTGFSLSSNLIIKGNLTIQAGYLDVSTSNYSINIAGSWTNMVGDAGFVERQSTVIFNGSLTQYLSSGEKFYNLTLAKTGTPTALWQSAGEDVFVTNNMALDVGYYRTSSECDTYVNNLSIAALACFDSDWTLYVSGNMTDYNTTYGASVGYVQRGVIVFNGAGTQTVTRSGVEFWVANLIINKPLGSICNFSKPVVTSGHVHINVGVWQDTANNFAHRIAGDLLVWPDGVIANNTGNTFSFVGDLAQQIFYGSSTGGFTNFIVNKGLGTATLYSNLALANPGNLSIESGNFQTNGYDIICTGHFNINSGTAAAYIQAGSTVRMGILKNLNVNAGLLSLAGSAADPVTVTSISGLYGFNVESGANISAVHTIFERMNANGVNIKNGALVNTTDPFKGCTFREGGIGTLLTLNSNQTLNIDDAVFPENSWGGINNVTKSVNWGTVNFNNATGDFAGAAFESDPYNRVNWLGGNPDLRITSVDWSSFSPYLCDPITATVQVQNNSSTNISTPFRVDLYKNRGSAPTAGILGDSFITIPSLAAGANINVTFTNISSDVTGVWTSWFQVDANSQITETNEGNNVWTPGISTTWNALPAATNVQALRSGNNIQLSWSYPISVYRFKIYKDTNPYGSFSTLAGTSFTPSFSAAVSGTKWFYRVRAERNLP